MTKCNQIRQVYPHYNLPSPESFLFKQAYRSYCPRMERRHAIRRGNDRLWEVYDVGDQKVLFVDGIPLIDLQVEEAVDALELLEAGFLVPSDTPAMA